MTLGEERCNEVGIVKMVWRKNNQNVMRDNLNVLEKGQGKCKHLVIINL